MHEARSRSSSPSRTLVSALSSESGRKFCTVHATKDFLKERKRGRENSMKQRMRCCSGQEGKRNRDGRTRMAARLFPYLKTARSVGRLWIQADFTTHPNSPQSKRNPGCDWGASSCRPPTRLVNKRMIGYRDEKLSSDPKTEGGSRVLFSPPPNFFPIAGESERASGTAAVFDKSDGSVRRLI